MQENDRISNMWKWFPEKENIENKEEKFIKEPIQETFLSIDEHEIWDSKGPVNQYHGRNIPR